MSVRQAWRHSRRGSLRRQGPGESVAIVTSERRIVAMRFLLSTTLLLAISVHWLTV